MAPTSASGVDQKTRGLFAIAFVTVLAAVLMGVIEPADAADNTIQTGSTSGFTVPAGQTWEFDPNNDVTLSSSGNIIVKGTLVMKPANGNVDHVLRFTGINESNFQGGGMVPLSTDVGLWVVDGGRIVLEGESKPAWAYTWQSGWVGDEVRAAPNTPGNYDNFPQVTSTPAKNALGYRTELLNLTRNVRVEGTSSGYAHVFIRSTRPSSIKYAAFRYVAPNPSNVQGASNDETGRYGVHFHHSGEGTRGTVVEGLVIRDTKNHSFVPHGSSGITFKDVIAYNVKGEAFWWDEETNTDDVVFDGAVAARVTGANGGNHHRVGAFFLGAGNNLTVINSVAVGMQNEGGAFRSGYIWPEDSEASWNFKNNVAHNNDGDGIFVWQNNELPHVIEDFTGYYNAQAGVEHGAYTNSYVYNGLTLLGNGTAIISHALGEPGDNNFTDTQIWANVVTNGGKLYIDEHGRDPERPVRFVNCDLGEVEVEDSGGPEHSEYDFINCGLEPGDFDLGGAKSNSVFRVQRANGTAYRLTGNGTVTSIAAFYSGGAIPGTGFIDTGGSVFNDAIEWLAAEGITKGCNPPANTKFCPDDPVTRGQMAAFLVRALGYSDSDGTVFSDAKGHVFESAIDKLATAGVTKGCNPPSNSRFCPDRPVTRGEMAAFLVRAMGYSNNGGGDKFIDDNSSVFEDAIDKLATAGITKGCNPPDNTRFCPSNVVTRGQMAAFLKRALD